MMARMTFQDRKGFSFTQTSQMPSVTKRQALA